MNSASEPVVQISALEHHAYCPRQCALIHVDGMWMDNSHTVVGTRAHRRVDTGADRVERGRKVLRGIPLFSEVYGLTGRADVVEIHEDGSVVPVEYKSGGRHGSAADVQLCAQALCLEEMTGSSVPVGFVWYRGYRHREQVDITDALRRETMVRLDEIRSALVSGRLPPAVADARCRDCQLEPVCMPDVAIRPASVTAYIYREVFACA